MRRGLCHYGIKVDHAVQAGGGKGGIVRAVLIGNHPTHSQATHRAGAVNIANAGRGGACAAGSGGRPGDEGHDLDGDGPEAVFPMAGVLKPKHKHRKYLQRAKASDIDGGGDNDNDGGGPTFSYPPVIFISHPSLQKIVEFKQNLGLQSTRRGGKSSGRRSSGDGVSSAPSEVTITVEPITTSHVYLLRNSELGAAVRGACLSGDETLLRCLIDHMADVDANGRRARTGGLSSLHDGHQAAEEKGGADLGAGAGADKGKVEGGGECEDGGNEDIACLAREVEGDGVSTKRLAVRGAEVLRFLDEQDVDRGVSALHVAVEAAVESQRYGCLAMLLEAGVDTELLRTDGYNALHIAVEAGNVEVATMLLDSGSWIDAPQVTNRHAQLNPLSSPCIPNHHAPPHARTRPHTPALLSPLSRTQRSAGAARLDQSAPRRQKWRPASGGAATR